MSNFFEETVWGLCEAIETLSQPSLPHWMGDHDNNTACVDPKLWSTRQQQNVERRDRRRRRG